MSEVKEAISVTSTDTTAVYTATLEVPQQSVQMQAATNPQQAIVPQASPQVQQQGLSQAGMAQVMSQGPQTVPSPHGVTASMPPQSPQYYVQASVGAGMQAPPAIAPAPGPQTTTTTVSAIHQPLQHHLTQQSLTHPGISPSPMPQFSPQVQVIQGSIPGAPYLQQVYQNAQGQLIMPIQPGMNAAPIQQGAINPIQVITAAGKPFQGQIAPHMLTAAGGKTGVLQQGQTGYTPVTNPTSGSQTVLISQLGGQLGVISSQPPNILPAHSTAPKPGEMHKVNNMQQFQQQQTATFGSVQQGIAWAAPAGALHSPTLLTAQNQPIFIRGGQPGQESVFIQSAQPQAMIPPNSMVPSIATMGGGPQQAKPRSSMEMQANIQPKVMRPPILPSITSGQIRPGASVSTQTATGQPIAPAHLGTPRSQGKVRGKTSANRASPAVGAQQQMNQIAVGQMLQQQQAATLSVSGATPLSAILPVSTQSLMVGGAAMHKQMTQVVDASGNFTQTVNANLTQTKPTTPVQSVSATSNVHPGIRLPKAPLISSAQITVPTTILTTVAAPVSLTMQTASAPVPIVSSTRPNSVPIMSSPNVALSVASSSPSDESKQTSTGSPQMSIPSSMQNGKPEKSYEMTPKKDISGASSTQTVSAGNTVTNTTASMNGGENGISHSVLNGTLSTAEKNILNGPPKAMVKPQVMTHVIEGFVIHEGSEPFPVNRSSLLSDLNKARTNNTATVLPQENISDEDKESSKCEVCGKTELRSKFKKGKRFCSSSCAKRFQMGTPKRVSPFKHEDESASKRFKDIGGPSEGTAATDAADNNHSTISEDFQGSADDIKMPKVDILKWTVKDVVEFIQNLPGCQDYAEDFELQEIDGQALMLLKADHLMSAMNLKLGPALKICNQIESMRGGEKKEA